MSYQPPADPSQQLPPADWYIDPEDSSQHRYWNGVAWTEHRSPRSGAPAAGPTATAGPSGPTATTAGPSGPTATTAGPSGPTATMAGPGGGLRRPGQMVADTLALTLRQWRPVSAAVAVLFAGQAVALVLLFMGANSMVDGRTFDIFGRTEAGIDTSSIETNLSLRELVPMLASVAIIWSALRVMTAAIPHIVVEDLAGRTVTAGSALGHGLSRVLRVIGLDVRIGLLAVAAMLVVAVPSAYVQLLSIVLYPAGMAAAVYAWVVALFAYTAVSVTTSEPPLRYAFDLVKGRFWKLLGRLVLVAVAVYAAAVVASIVLSVGAALSGSLMVDVTILALTAVISMAASAMVAVAAAICYRDLGGATA